MASDDRVLLAVDAGTSGARAVAVDLEGRVVAAARRAYKTSTPRPGWAEQNPADWSGRALEALGAVAGRLEGRWTPVAIGLTGQCPTVAPYDAAAHPVGPGMLYMDNRAHEEAVEMRRRLPAPEMHRRTGHIAQAFHVGPKVLWLRRHDPATFTRARHFLQPRDAVLHALTGRVATDQTHANATLFYDLEARAWAPDLFEGFDLDPGLFPEALEPWAIAGELPSGRAGELGLPAGLPVVVGAADSQCAAFGAGALEAGPVSEMAGASSCLNSAVTQPLPDLRVTHYSHAVPDRYCTELGLNTAGSAIGWARARLGYPTFAAMAADATGFRRQWLRSGRAGAVDVAPLFLPYLGDGERDDPDLRSAWLGLSLRHTRAALAHSVLEGVALGVGEVLKVLVAAGSPLDELRSSGGGARLDLLGRLKADILDCPVVHLEADATDVGCALLAGAAAGLEAESAAARARVLARGMLFEPDDAAREVVEVRSAWFRQALAHRATHAPSREDR